MATPVLDQVSIDLAYKLQDPVVSGLSNGVRLSAGERFRYIIRAYRRLLRAITILYPDLIQKIYHDFYKPATGTTNSIGQITTLTDWSEVFEVFVKEPTDENYTKAYFISPEDFAKVEYGINTFYRGDLNTNKYYWTRRSDNIHIVPMVSLDYKVIYRPDTAAIIEGTGQGGAIDLDIATEYLDLLLSFASAEAYLDIGQGNVAGAYKQDVNEQLSLLAGLTNKMEKKDETTQP